MSGSSSPPLHEGERKQIVGFDELLEVAFCHGWADIQTKQVEAETDAIGFLPRRAGSNWSERNRAIVRRLLAAGRRAPAGLAPPPDLDADR